MCEVWCGYVAALLFRQEQQEDTVCIQMHDHPSLDTADRIEADLFQLQGKPLPEQHSSSIQCNA